jgi:hypothetical protein
MDLLPWPSNLLPHPWCENTVSHHGVKAAAPMNIIVFTRKEDPKKIISNAIVKTYGNHQLFERVQGFEDENK